jgi:hypothetical protein
VQIFSSYCERVESVYNHCRRYVYKAAFGCSMQPFTGENNENLQIVIAISGIRIGVPDGGDCGRCANFDY